MWGKGNPNAPILMIPDNPGAWEDRQENVFLCGTRETLRRGMREAGTYLLKCRPIRAYNKPAAREACASHLHLQIQEKQPLLLFGFGDVVAETLFPWRWKISCR
ncbi:uracil-DNA glycosylase family protein [Ferviditalea candida]|uniref:uracil-DNA glycosylase family protein n=1 Tax=Ferviditalea candida TaxID=3108399 RepID=UPI00352CF4F9